RRQWLPLLARQAKSTTKSDRAQKSLVRIRETDLGSRTGKTVAEPTSKTTGARGPGHHHPARDRALSGERRHGLVPAQRICDDSSTLVAGCVSLLRHHSHSLGS